MPSIPFPLPAFDCFTSLFCFLYFSLFVHMMKSERCFSRPVESVVFALREFLHLLTVVTFAIGAPGMVSPACDPPPLYLRFYSRPAGLYYLFS